MEACKNCHQKLTGPYCAQCGQPASAKRIDGHYIRHEIEHVLHFEKGILFTIKELLLRPGKNIREFIAENRSRLVKPILFIIISSLIYTLINHFFHIESGYISYKGAEKSATNAIMTWLQDHLGYTNIIMGVFIAFWLKVFFRKYNYNFFELLILLCFAMGMTMLIFSVFALLQGLTHIDLMRVSGILAVIYLVWAIGQFFDNKKFSTYFNAFMCYLLGMLSFTGVALFIGFGIDYIIKA